MLHNGLQVIISVNTHYKGHVAQKMVDAVGMTIVACTLNTRIWYTSLSVAP